jgi:hypothetical protein
VEKIPKEKQNVIQLLFMTQPKYYRNVIHQTTNEDLLHYGDLLREANINKLHFSTKLNALKKRVGEINTAMGNKMRGTKRSQYGFGFMKHEPANTIDEHGYLGDAHIDKKHLFLHNELVVRNHKKKEVMRTPATEGLIHLLTSPNISKRAKKAIRPHDIEVWQSVHKIGNIKPKSLQRRQLMNNPAITYQNPHAQIERLHVLCGSVDAGNKGKLVKQQIAMVLDDLLREKAISKSDHKSIYQGYVL